MSEISGLTGEMVAKMRFRSMGLKLIVVCGLALVMLIPALFVWLLVEDRSKRADEVVSEISEHVGGQQMFLGPTLAIPYTIPAVTATDSTKHGIYLVFPTRGTGVVKVATEERRRSLFKVPVFRADAQLSGSFDLSGLPAAAPPGAQLEWDRAEMVVGVSDPRGALADAVLSTGGKTLTLFPASVAQNLSVGGEGSPLFKLTLLGTKIEGVVQPNAKFDAAATLKFSGAQRLAVLAYGKTTQLKMQGDWASPGFDGGFLPVTRNVSNSGFDADWSVPFIARGVRAEGTAESITGLDATALGVSFIEVADPYQSVTRSLKYVVLFLGLIFLSYFIFEVTTGKTRPSGAVSAGGHRPADLLSVAAVAGGADRIRFWIPAGGCGNGKPAGGQCGMDLCEQEIRFPRPGDIRSAVSADLFVAAAGGQCLAGGRGSEFCRGCCSDVSDARH